MTASVVTVLIFLACVAGCSSQVAPAGTAASVPSSPQAPAKTHATLEPEQMVLQISDLPGNYTLVTSGERNASKVQSWMHNAGWKKGYAVLFQKNESGSSAHPAIWHYVYQFPVENASRVVSLQVDGLVIYDAQDERNRNTTFLELASPGIGDTSRAVSIADKDDPEIMNMIAFSKYDVYEELWCNATPADYENLKKVAAIAAAKIE
ncbi:hypothetical protein [Methanoregula sp.]|jgi:hypothetical protein|uniref:hypothetical protein n=1 Tax=Methanoregula sp. TaxID=2052170 RepID=UPI003566AA84